jgi:hypothetical protein
MLHSDSQKKPAIQTSRLVAAIGTTFAVAIDMLAMASLTLFYDGLVATAIFATEFLHYSKSGSNQLLPESIAIGWLGIGVGLLGTVFLIARKKYCRAGAAVLGLVPLVFFIYHESAPMLVPSWSSTTRASMGKAVPATERAGHTALVVRLAR